MNLVAGQIRNGVFSAPGVEVTGLSAADGDTTLGFRAEDANVCDFKGQIEAPVYTLELLGDATNVAVKVAGALVSVKAHKDYRIEIGTPVAISVPAHICHLFDTQTGDRIGN
jgi:multiple sugar transport system ATP-binding protein